MSRYNGVFDNDGIVRTRPMEQGYKTEINQTKYHKPKRRGYVAVMNNQEIINFCLNCTKKACPYGTCVELEDFIRAKKAEGKIL